MAFTRAGGRKYTNALMPFILAYQLTLVAITATESQAMQKIRFYNTSDRTFTIIKAGGTKGFELGPNAGVTKDTETGQEWTIHSDPYTFTQFTIGAGHNQAIVFSDGETTFFPTAEGEGQRLIYIGGGRSVGEGG